MQIEKPLTVYIPDTRGVTLSRYGHGNLKLGPTVFTYSRLPGLPSKAALGFPVDWGTGRRFRGTCPGATDECVSICYAARPVAEQGVVYKMWEQNSRNDDVPPIPDECKLLRLHVSGDFNSVPYTQNWINRLIERSDVVCWVYTRSWRVSELLPHLESLRRLQNVQMFASMDSSTQEMPPDGWRRAWIDGDSRAGEVHRVAAHSELATKFADFALQRTEDAVKTLICPEETLAVKDCEECGFCFAGQRNDVTFLRH